MQIFETASVDEILVDYEGEKRGGRDRAETGRCLYITRGGKGETINTVSCHSITLVYVNLNEPKFLPHRTPF